MKPVSTLGVGTLALGIASIVVAIAWPARKPPPPPPVVPVSRVAVNVCGVTPAILIAYSDGSVRGFYPPFEALPKQPLPNDWEQPIEVSTCTGKVTLDPNGLGF